MVIRVISRAKITQHKTIALDKEITDILEAYHEDDILYILNKNGIVNVRKFKGDVILGPGEKYLSSCTVSHHGDQFAVTITGDVRQVIDVDIGDDVLLIIDDNRNMIIRHAFLSNRCSIDILNKNISALVIDITTLWPQKNQTSLPKNVRDILGVDEGDIITLSLDESDNIIVHQEVFKNLLQKAKLLKNVQFTVSKEVSNILNIIPGDKILWIIDEDGNIIMRNAILSDNCI